MRCLSHCPSSACSSFSAPARMHQAPAPASMGWSSFLDLSEEQLVPDTIAETNFPGGGKMDEERENMFLLWNFDVGSSILKLGHLDEIKQITPKLKALIEGNSDFKVDIEGRASQTGTKNQQLSERRANAVKDALVKEGIPASKINVDAVSDTKSLGGVSQENYARNRAVRVTAAPRLAPPPIERKSTADQFPDCQIQLTNDMDMKAGGKVDYVSVNLGTKRLQAGDENDPGMVFTVAAGLQGGCNGEVEFVQNVQTYREFVLKDRSRTTLSSSSFMLDTTDPYCSQHFSNSPQVIVDAANDSPSQGVPSLAEPMIHTVEVRDDFRMFVLFKPAGQARKALQVGVWSFVAQLRNTDPRFDEGELKLDSAVSRVTPSIGSAQNTKAMPVLSPNITDLKWTVTSQVADPLATTLANIFNKKRQIKPCPPKRGKP